MVAAESEDPEAGRQAGIQGESGAMIISTCSICKFVEQFYPRSGGNKKERRK